MLNDFRMSVSPRWAVLADVLEGGAMRALPCLLIAVSFASGCTDQKCNADTDCDDGLFCNGASTCLLGRCTKPTPPACDDGLACTVDRCSEEYRQCQHSAPDVDHDGYGDARCLDSIGVALGTDCADDDVNRYPGNREVCDTHDEDCDPTTLGGKDSDNDGFVDVACTNPLSDGGVVRGTDCDDSNDGIHRGQLERCNRVDDNCNGMTDEGVQLDAVPKASRLFRREDVLAFWERNQSH